VHFPEARSAMIADSVETMGHCLLKKSALVSRLDEAAEHDVTAWQCDAAEALRNVLDVRKTMKEDLFSRMRTGRVWIDVGGAFEAGVHVDFADEQSAKLGKDLLAASGEVGAAGLGLWMGFVRVEKALPEVWGDDESAKELLELAPAGLLARAEKGLRKAHVEA